MHVPTETCKWFPLCNCMYGINVLTVFMLYLELLRRVTKATPVLLALHNDRTFVTGELWHRSLVKGQVVGPLHLLPSFFSIQEAVKHPLTMNRTHSGIIFTVHSSIKHKPFTAWVQFGF